MHVDSPPSGGILARYFTVSLLFKYLASGKKFES